MKKFPKFITMLITFVITFNIFANAGMSVSAAEETPNEVDEDVREQVKEDLVDELEFYFETVGYVNEDQEYVITDEEAFIQKIESDINIDIDEVEENTSTMQSTNSDNYIICVVVNSIPFGSVAWEIATATSELDGFFAALTALNFQVAADMIIDVASMYLTDTALQELSNISLVANIDTSIVSCGLDL